MMKRHGVTIGGERQLLASISGDLAPVRSAPRAGGFAARAGKRHLIGGCDVAAELDARRAIARGTNRALAMKFRPGVARCAFPGLPR
ncbi:hypothetical protein MJ584_24050 [Klebsiella pneumoniae]|nr:hypothetical protein MJ584_24050 [Klebsiella pneumoniae]